MRHFQPSYHSSIDYTRYNYDLAGINYDLGVADVGETSCVRVKDPQGGNFDVCSDGVVIYIDGGPANYPAKNTQWKKGVDGAFDEIVGNLSTAFGGSQKAKIEAVLGSGAVSVGVAAARQAARSVPQAAGTSALTGVEDDPGGKVPLTKQPWFWPAVIGVVGAVTVTGIVVYRRRSA
jgi:hypothetical protein